MKKKEKSKQVARTKAQRPRAQLTLRQYAALYTLRSVCDTVRTDR
jgi:hypothetical protein